MFLGRKNDIMVRKRGGKVKSNNKVLSAIMCALSCALIIVGAFIRIPLSPLAITLQAEFVLLSALLLGARKACGAVGIYILLGLCGIPVFTQGGGLSYVLKPSFGFIIGFLVAGAVTGYMAMRLKKYTFSNIYMSCLAGLAVMYVLGVAYFYFITRFYLDSYIGFMSLISTCVFMTLPIDAVLCVPVAFCAKRLVPILKKHNI